MPKNIKDIDGLAILSGDGLLPVILAKFSKRKKIRFIVVSFQESNKKLDQFNPIFCDVRKPLALINVLRSLNINYLILAGSFPRLNIQGSNKIKGDSAFEGLIQENYERGDDSFLRGVAKFFEGNGFHILGAHELAEDILETEQKILSIKKPSTCNIRDTKLAFNIFKNFSNLDLGQSIIISSGLCFGLENASGTDAMIEGYINFLRRKSAHSRHKGGIFFKASKGIQDRRFDLPTIGTQTIKLVSKAKLDGIVVESSNVIFIEKTKIIKLADSLGIFLWSRSNK
mgnify:FL=1